MDIATSKHLREIRHVYSMIRKPQAVGYLTTYEWLRVRLFPAYNVGSTDSYVTSSIHQLDEPPI